MKPAFLILFSFISVVAFGQEVLKTLIEPHDSGRIREARFKAEAKNKRKLFRKEGEWMEYLNNWGEISKDTNSPYYMLCNYHNGKLSGIGRIYDEFTGKLFLEVPYDENGKETGTERQYYESGKIEYERQYLKGKRNGTLKGYYENGNLEVEGHWANGEENGIEKGYYENGNLKIESPVVNSKKDGVEKEYFENGKLKSEKLFRNDTLQEQKNYDENGNEIK